MIQPLRSHSTWNVPLFAAIVCMAALLRLLGIGYGLPYLYHQDESIIVNHAMAIGLEGWNFHFFVIPPFTMYSLFVIYGAYFVLGRQFGFFLAPEDFALQFLDDPSVFYLIGRSYLGVLYGVLTVLVLGWIGRRFFSARIGYLSAALLAVCHLHVQHSHYIYADIPLTLVSTLLLGGLFWLSQSSSSKGYIWIGVLLGWGISIKYTMVYFVPAILIAHILAHRHQLFSVIPAKRILLAALSSVVVFFVISPYVFLDWNQFIQQMKIQSGSQIYTGWSHHLNYALLGGMGWGVMLLALVGLVRLCIKDRNTALITVVFFASYYFMNVHWGQHFARYSLPLVPIVCLWASLGIQTLWQRVSHRFIKNIVLLLIVMEMLLPTFYSNKLFLQKDTRSLCKEWVNQNLSPGSTIVMDNRFFGPRLDQSKRQLGQQLQNLAQDRVSKHRQLQYLIQVVEKRKTYELFILAETQEKHQSYAKGPFVGFDPKALKNIGAQYLVLSYGEFTPDRSGKLDKHVMYVQELKKTLHNKIKLIKSFSPYRDPHQKAPLERFSSTGAPHLLRELRSRDRLGPYLEVFQFIA